MDIRFQPLNLGHLALCTAIVLSSPSVGADSFPHSFVPPSDLPEPAAATLQRLAHKHADTMYRFLQLKIDELDRTVKLSDAQKSRLNTAAKGAVQDSLEEWLNPILSRLMTGSDHQKRTLLARLGGPAAANRGVVIVGQPQLAEGFVRGIAGAPGDPAELRINTAAVLNHEIFTSTIEVLLTPEQQAALKQTDSDRLVAADTRMDQLMNEISGRLMLDAEQREQISQLVSKHRQRLVVSWLDGQSALPVRDVADFTLRSLPFVELKRVLTPAQLEVWEHDMRKSPAGVKSK
jgi:hypothetical protein